jgi:hypothetical protein
MSALSLRPIPAVATTINPGVNRAVATDRLPAAVRDESGDHDRNLLTPTEAVSFAGNDIASEQHEVLSADSPCG